jgi:hypothetical protein
MSKTKPNTELCSILNKNQKLVSTQDAYLRTQIKNCTELLNGQTNNTDDITGNSYTTENSNIPDKTKVNMSDLETAMR